MKISDGNWLIQPGPDRDVSGPCVDVEQQGNDLVVYVAPRDVRERAWQLDTLMFTVRLFAPQKGLSGCASSTSRGRRTKARTIRSTCWKDVRVETVNNAEYAELKAGNLSVRVTKGEDSGRSIFCVTASGSPAVN